MKKTDPNFDRFRAAVTRDHLPDRLPVCEIEIDMEIMDAFLGRSVASVKDYAEFWRRAGYDYALLFVLGQPLPDHFHQFKIGQKTQSESLSSSTFDVNMGVKDQKTFEKYPWIGPEEVFYDDVDAIREYLPDGMKLVVNQGPLFSGMWRVMGLEAFAIACYENPDLIRAVAEKMGELCVNIAENILQRDWVGAYWMGDDMAYTTSLMVSPDFLRTYVFPYYKRIGDLCRRYEKPFLLHSDGDNTEVFEDFIECGVAAMHPNEPTSVDVVGLKKEYGDRLGFLGALDVDLLTRGTVEDVVKATRYLIENAATGGGYALGSGNSITRHVPLGNYKAMLETVRSFGGIY